MQPITFKIRYHDTSIGSCFRTYNIASRADWIVGLTGWYWA
jgi:hypothetical protein